MRNFRSHTIPAILAALSVLSVGALGACHKGGDQDEPEKLEPKVLGDSGFVVDAPVSWKVKMQMAGFYDVGPETGHQFVGFMISDGAGPTSLDDALTTASCKDPGSAIKQQTAAGAFFVQCTKEIGTYDNKPIMGTTIRAQLTAGKSTILCHLDTDRKPDLPAQVCKSLRTK